MLLKDILTTKGGRVFTIQVGARLAEVVRELVTHNVGSLVVCEGETPVGIVTERDILRTVAAADAQLRDIDVRERMTAPIITGSLNDDVEAVMGVMTEKRIRHLPVLDQGKLVGMVSIGDVVKAHLAHVTMENRQLLNYIQS